MGLALSPAQLLQFETYVNLLARWNSTINLTSLSLQSPTNKTFDRLLLGPIAAAKYVPESAAMWFDLGSGGGIPAIPLKIMRPASGLTMVESRARKAAFLQEVVRELGLGDSQVENARFEVVSKLRAHTAELVTVQAVRADKVLFDSAGQLLAPGGRLLWFGGSSPRAIPFGFDHVDASEQPPSGVDAIVLQSNVPRGTKPLTS